MKQFKDFYRLRSSLVHGSLSPFDPEVEEECELALQHAGKALRAAFHFFYSQKLLDRPVSNRELIGHFEQLIRWAENVVTPGERAEARSPS